jgi:hypothetical protein
MIAKGRVQNGVVVLEKGVSLPEGREVTVVTANEEGPPYQVSEERKRALLELIGAWKMENPPDDAEVERIIDEERMRKYGQCVYP